jgi:hypothetical protein
MTYTITNEIPIQIGCRIRLSSEQRDALKAAFLAASTAHSAPVQGKGISVQTAVVSTVESELALDRLTFASLVNSRESLPLPLALRMQRVLGVELVSEAKLNQAFKGYVAHIKSQHPGL